MAEFVEQRIEETIPEIEEMERIGLLTTKEVKKLIQKRRDYHYRMARKLKSKADYMNYIDYEKKLLELLKIRRKQIRMYEKKQQIEYSITHRVMKHVRYLTRIWPGHLDTWKLRISFAQFVGWKEEIGCTYAEQAQYHGNDESLWVAWAKWEIEGRHNFDHARTILLSKAPILHPRSLLIKRELFRLELLYVESLMKEGVEGLDDAAVKKRQKVLECAVARAVYCDAVKTIPEPDLYVQLYQVADKFEFACSIREEIYRDLLEQFPAAACVWKLKARRRVSGLSDVTVPGADVEKVNTGLGNISLNVELQQHKEHQVSCNIAEENQDGPKEEGESRSKDKNEKNIDGISSTEPAADVKEGGKNISHIAAIEASKNIEPIDKLRVLMATYDEAVTQTGQSFLKTYVGELLPLLHQCWTMPPMVSIICHKLTELFENHITALSPLDFFVWVRVMVLQSGHSGAVGKVLDEALQLHPEVGHLQLEQVRHLISVSTSDVKLTKVFKELGLKLKGECGLRAWEEVVSHVQKEALKERLYTRAMDHQDEDVARHMRVQHLTHTTLHKGITSARNLYEKLSWRPPFCAKIHAKMVALELNQKEVDTARIRKVFSNALQQYGSSQPGVWLAFILFEKHRGDPLQALAITTRAEKELDADGAHIFRELYSVVTETADKDSAVPSPNEDQQIFIENIEFDASDKEDDDLTHTSVQLFKEELLITYTENQTRIKFFSAISNMKKSMLKGDKKSVCVEAGGREWEPVLQSLTGHQVTVAVQQVTVKPTAGQGDPSSGVTTLQSYGQHQLSDQLQPEEKPVKKEKSEVEKVLKDCVVLQPGFMQQTHVVPYIVSKKRAKLDRKKEREKTKGPGWFDMKAPELTEEVKRDLEILQMRSVLDPKRHSKSSDMKELPKYFQIGTVVDNPVEFYSSRIPKKSRKRTLAEEIIHDEEALRYQKRKYKEIITAKQKKQFKHKHQPKKGKTKTVKER